ncbi:hypothetical protein PoB_000294400 [Plakobranchus ocellatus]|uniref:Uncharacterized protein n=1 Tax=Plakobranchus ocellatus TaxID=259542 RepID=A0AAV3Y0G3_9GAST|nr:hypothetical protein PoB_000294400 [Plakobranchus ocellatus]
MLDLSPFALPRPDHVEVGTFWCLITIVAANNKYRDDTTKDQGQRLHIGDKALLRQHQTGRNKLQARYHDSLYTIVATPEDARYKQLVLSLRLRCASIFQARRMWDYAHWDRSDNDVIVPATKPGTGRRENDGREVTYYVPLPSTADKCLPPSHASTLFPAETVSSDFQPTTANIEADRRPASRQSNVAIHQK